MVAEHVSCNLTHGRVRELTCVCVLKAGSAAVEGAIDSRHYALVQLVRAVEQIDVFRASEKLVGRNSRLRTAARALQPAIVLTATAGGHQRHGDQLIPFHRRRDHSAIP